MAFSEIGDNPYDGGPGSFDKGAFESWLKQAEDVRPGTFRYYDPKLDGEVQTSTENPGGVKSVARVEVFHRDGTSGPLATAHFDVGGGEAKLYPDSVRVVNNENEVGVLNALLSEIGDQARSQDATKLTAWVPEGDTAAETLCRKLGFHPSMQQRPGGGGSLWEHPL